MKTTSRKDKTNGSMGSSGRSNNHRPRETQDQKKETPGKQSNGQTKKGVGINGSVDRSLVVPSSSCESQGGGVKSEKPVGSKRRHASNGSPSESSNKQRRKKEEEEEEEEEEESKLTVIPMNRVQRIVKSEGPNLKINQDAYFLINKAAEKFIGQFCEDAYTSAAPKDRKRFLKYSHLSSVVSKERRYDFLSDFVPEKIRAEDAIKDIKSEEK